MGLGNMLRNALLSGFFKAGFTYEKAGNLEGWLTRDPYTNDWILWSLKTNQIYRRSDWHSGHWQPSPESKEQCLKLGQVYADIVRIK